MYSFDLAEDFVRVKDKISKREFTVSYADYFAYCSHIKEAMNIAAAADGTSYTLPPGCLNIDFPSQKTIGLEVLIPEQRRSIIYSKIPETPYLIVAPRLKMKVLLVGVLSPKGVLQWSAKTITFHLALDAKGQELRHVPLPNVYSDGKVCWGGNAYNTPFPGNDLSPVMKYYEVFMSSPFNTDLWISFGEFSGPQKWFEHLSSVSEFPYDLLRSYSS